MPTYEGRRIAGGRPFAIVAAQFNETIVSSLVEGARSTLLKHGVPEEAITVAYVPGAFEIPPVAERLARSGGFAGVICLGAVIRGATPHFDYVAGEAAGGIARVAASAPCPVIFGVLTTETIEQAIERAGTKAGNKGSDAAVAALEMADLYASLDRDFPTR